jgi:hypothetical protein
VTAGATTRFDVPWWARGPIAAGLAWIVVDVAVQVFPAHGTAPRLFASVMLTMALAALNLAIADLGRRSLVSFESIALASIFGTLFGITSYGFLAPGIDHLARGFAGALSLLGLVTFAGFLGVEFARPGRDEERRASRTTVAACLLALGTLPIGTAAMSIVPAAESPAPAVAAIEFFFWIPLAAVEERYFRLRGRAP